MGGDFEMVNKAESSSFKIPQTAGVHSYKIQTFSGTLPQDWYHIVTLTVKY